MSEVGELGELVESGRNGYLVRAGDAVGFASVIRTLLEDERLFKRLSAQGAVDAGNLCGASAISRRWSEVLTELVACESAHAPERARPAASEASSLASSHASQPDKSLALVDLARLHSAIQRGLKPSGPAEIEIGPAPGPSAKRATLLVLGDVVLAGNVGKAIEQQDMQFPWVYLPPEFFDVDVILFNQEGCHSQKGEPVEDKPVTLRGGSRYLDVFPDPRRCVAHLANNHFLDFGAEAGLDNVAELSRRGFDYIGLQGTAVKAQPLIRRTPAGSIGFLGCTSVAHPLEDGTRINVVEGDTDRMCELVRELRAQVDLVIVMMHQGVEYCRHPHPVDRERCRRLCLAGADLVVNHHPHVVQGIEAFGSGMVFHSLGNFVSEIFDARFPESARTFALRVQIADSRIWRLDVEPCVINGHLQTVPMDGTQREAFLLYLRGLSMELHDETASRQAMKYARRFRLRTRLRYACESAGRIGLLPTMRYYLGRVLRSWSRSESHRVHPNGRRG